MFRRFAADGTPLGAEVTVTSTDNTRIIGLAVALAGDGSLVIVWGTEQETAESELYVRRYGANDAPLGDAVAVTDAASKSIGWFDVASAAGGHFVVVWSGDDDLFDDDGFSAFARLFDASAVPQGAPFPASTAEPGFRNFALPRVAMSNAGNFVVTWFTEDAAQVAALFGRRFDANGAAIGDTFAVASGASAPGIQDHRVAMSATGQFVVIYSPVTTIPGEPDPWSTGLYGRRFDAAAASLGGEFRVSAAGNVRLRAFLAIDSNANGDFAVTWTEYVSSGNAADPYLQYLHARLYRASGSPATSDQRYSLSWLGFSWSGNSVAIDSVGNFANAFYALGRLDNGVGTQWVYVQRFAGYNDKRPACARYIATVVGNDSANDLNGGSGHDVVYAGGGNDTIHAWSGDDVICGGPGADVIYGGSGNDDLVGGPGDDVLDGGRGSDFCNGESHTNADTAVSCEITRNVP
jgi:Ca2+-binding RTX toxin-like protein